MFITTSFKLARSNRLRTLTEDKLNPWPAAFLKAPEGIFTWGKKRPAFTKFLSLFTKKPVTHTEDGFIRSFHRNDSPLSIITDSQGIYYDATAPSDLEDLIKDHISEEDVRRTSLLVGNIKHYGISKYNSQKDYEKNLPSHYVLVVDQVRNDSSIRCGGASSESFQLMLQKSITDHPEKVIIIKQHPDIFTKKKAGHFSAEYLAKLNNPRVQVIAENCHPIRLIEKASEVYVVTSQVGFEALLYDKLVHTFGMPFYAGWGLTNDFLPSPSRRKAVQLANLIHAALIRYPTYFNEHSDNTTSVESVIAKLGRKRNSMLESQQTIYAIGFSKWKESFIPYFMDSMNVEFISEKNIKLIPNDAPVIVWGSKYREELNSYDCVFRIEDGFLRSSGLGADLIRPVSLVVDGIGIYFDSTRPSGLEEILNESRYSVEALSRAKKLKYSIINKNLTKYNVGLNTWKRPENDKKVILVPGQVESDASIEFGSILIKTNFDLLHEVRQANPDAHIVYKPHPDVVARLRKQGKSEHEATVYADEVVTKDSADSLIGKVDEVHTITSLMGFEALIRGVKVHCYGMPFYAGWGLTHDRYSCSRRTRSLTLHELIHGVLIDYPQYIDYESGDSVSCEDGLYILDKAIRTNPAKTKLFKIAKRYILSVWASLRLEDRP